MHLERSKFSAFFGSLRCRTEMIRKFFTALPKEKIESNQTAEPFDSIDLMVNWFSRKGFQWKVYSTGPDRRSNRVKANGTFHWPWKSADQRGQPESGQLEKPSCSCKVFAKDSLVLQGCLICVSPLDLIGAIIYETADRSRYPSCSVRSGHQQLNVQTVIRWPGEDGRRFRSRSLVAVSGRLVRSSFEHLFTHCTSEKF